MIGQAGNAVEVGSAGYRIIVDVPSAHPKLGFDSYSRALSRIVRESAPRFAIGVFGSWGSGKTTLMEALRIELETTPDRIITVPFSAWRYEKEEHLIVPLIDSIREAVMKWSETRDPKVAETARKGAALLGRVTKALLAGLSLKVGVPGTLDVSFEANKALSAAAAAGEEAEAARVPRSFYQAAFNALNEAFTSMGTGEGTRIVVFIDDLDRCLPTGALEVLESMKLFFDLPGFIFVVGLDRSVVEWCIDSRYQRERPAGAAVSADAYSVKGADYINKIFQVPFTLPPVAVSDMDEFIDAVIEDNGLVDPQANHLRHTVGPHLAYVVGDLGVNPRRLKQYINSYILQVSVKPKLDAHAVLAIQTITYRDDWKVVRGALYTDRHLLLSALGNTDVGARREALEDLDPEYADIPDSFLAYVAEGPAGAAGNADSGPGRPLLAVGELIDEYLYAGEATLSTVSTPLLTIIPRVGKLRRLLRLAIGDDGVLNQQHLEDFRKELGVVQSNVTSVPGAMAQLVARALEDMLASAGPIDPAMSAEALKSWRAENESQITLAKKNLLRAYDASRTPAGNVDQGASSSVAS